ncbi:hypothetical protein O181_033317 [Austropuccinia psidii MF-1]|uniref:protein-histidine N-methyltransferase n=1 Tax=Austropuccinia psidii MF-1 TaxID=1389203 RepID=A0A9Q3H727_9BASI|nr:hypothetical protein [Austropuccinia psidii MF-1]
MFKFNFEIGQVNNQLDQHSSQNLNQNLKNQSFNQINLNHDNIQSDCQNITLSQIINHLPPFISFSTLKINSNHSILKRDLYDAKYQSFLNQDQESLHKSLDSILQAPSDLIPGIYEGGFKTWECSIDLASHLNDSIHLLKSHLASDSKKTFKILEIGCGSAVPTSFLCFELFKHLLKIKPLFKLLIDKPNQQINNHNQIPQIKITLQDFNSDVLKLLTLPNILLAFYHAHQLDQNKILKASDDLEITQELKSNFITFLNFHQLEFEFIHGPWSTFQPEPCNLIYSSETIYSLDSIQDFVKIIFKHKTLVDKSKPIILVAAKTIYFGVGGGYHILKELVEGLSGTIDLINSDQVGIGKVVMKIHL